MTDAEKAYPSTSIDSLLSDLRRKPAYREAERSVTPYHQLAVEIINRRAELGLTQKELAIAAETHQSRISKIESGEYDIRLSTLINIAEALGNVVQIRLASAEDTAYIAGNSPTHKLFETATVSLSASNYLLYTPSVQYQSSVRVTSRMPA